MRVIATTDLSREGSACYIQESISLIEQFGLYVVIKFFGVIGNDSKDIEILYSSIDCGKAVAKYDSLGGKI